MINPTMCFDYSHIIGWILSPVVALKATFSAAQQALVKIEQCFVDLIYIVVILQNKEFNDPVEGAGLGQGIACPANQVPGFLQIQLQGDGKGNRCGLGRIIALYIHNFGEQPTVYIGLPVNFRIFLSGTVYVFQRRILKSHIILLQEFLQINKT